MSITLKLSSDKSILHARYFPPIVLEHDSELSLLSLICWHSIKNVDETNNCFYYGDDKVVKIPIGCYEITDINKYLQRELKRDITELTDDEKVKLKGTNLENNAIVLEGNRHTLHSEITCRYPVNFMRFEKKDKLTTKDTKLTTKLTTKDGKLTTKLTTKDGQLTTKDGQLTTKDGKLTTKDDKPSTTEFYSKNNIGTLLGFEDIVTKPFEKCISNKPVNILKVQVIRVSCNIVSNSYEEGQPSHVIYEFFPNVAPGFKVIENPRQLIYHKLNTRVISEIEVKFTDQSDQLLNLRGEAIHLRLHIRPCQ